MIPMTAVALLLSIDTLLRVCNSGTWQVRQGKRETGREKQREDEDE